MRQRRELVPSRTENGTESEGLMGIIFTVEGVRSLSTVGAFVTGHVRSDCERGSPEWFYADVKIEEHGRSTFPDVVLRNHLTDRQIEALHSVLMSHIAAARAGLEFRHEGDPIPEGED